MSTGLIPSVSQILTDLGAAGAGGELETARTVSNDGSVEGSLGERVVGVFVSSEDSVEEDIEDGDGVLLIV